MLKVKRAGEPGSGHVPCPMCRIVVMDRVCSRSVGVRCTVCADNVPSCWCFVREGPLGRELGWEVVKQTVTLLVMVSNSQTHVFLVSCEILVLEDETRAVEGYDETKFTVKNFLSDPDNKKLITANPTPRPFNERLTTVHMIPTSSDLFNDIHCLRNATKKAF